MKKIGSKFILGGLVCAHIKRGMMFLGLSAVLLLSLSQPAGAASVIQCHCFKDRSFDPKKPALADPYFLAAAQNSFLASVFEIPKKDIVRTKMSGVAGDDIWIAHYLAGALGRDVNSLLNEKNRSKAWKAVVASMPENALGHKSKFYNALFSGTSDKILALIIIDDILIRRLQVGPLEIKKMRALGAGAKETILAIFLSFRMKCPPSEVFRPISLGEASWGPVLDRLSVDPQKFEYEFQKLLK